MSIQKAVLFVCFIFVVFAQGGNTNLQGGNTRYIDLGTVESKKNDNPGLTYPTGNQFTSQQCCGFNTIKIRGEGSVSAQPDVAVISVSAQQVASDTQTAIQKVNKKIASALAIIKLYAVQTDIQTQAIYTYPQYKYENGASSITGQIAGQNLIIKIRDIGKGQKVAQFIDKLSIINGIVVNYISFEIGNRDPYVNQARTNAFNEAKQKAKDYAEFSSIRLTKVSTVQDNSYEAPTPQPLQDTATLKVAGNSLSTTTIDPSQLTISADVTVTYEYI